MGEHSGTGAVTEPVGQGDPSGRRGSKTRAVRQRPGLGSPRRGRRHRRLRASGRRDLNLELRSLGPQAPPPRPRPGLGRAAAAAVPRRRSVWLRRRRRSQPSLASARARPPPRYRTRPDEWHTDEAGGRGVGVGVWGAVGVERGLGPGRPVCEKVLHSPAPETSATEGWAQRQSEWEAPTSPGRRQRPREGERDRDDKRELERREHTGQDREVQRRTGTRSQ